MDMVYFIRIPKTGSQAMIKLIRTYLRRIHHFEAYIRTPRPVEKPYLTAYEQEVYVLETIEKGENVVFMGMHENYIEYASFGYDKPIFMSLVRDPVEKEISWYYYIRSKLYEARDAKHFQDEVAKYGGEANWRNRSFETCVREHDPNCQYIPLNPQLKQSYKRQSLQFCGNYEACWTFGSPIAIQMAKDNIERNFAVVGSWEDEEITLTVLEHYIPKYFKGALKLYQTYKKDITGTNRNDDKPPVSQEIKDILYKNFTGEMDLYYFCKQRLYKQFLAIVNHDVLEFN